ncbi:hypothetical protein [Nonomuraea sp. bgisy101]
MFGGRDRLVDDTATPRLPQRLPLQRGGCLLAVAEIVISLDLGWMT